MKPSDASSRMTVKGAGPAVVFVHGVGLDRSVWLAQIDALRALHTVVAYDLPGHGVDAAVDDVPSMDLDAYAEDLLSVLDAAGIESATLVGGAFGGCIARRLAVREPSRVASLVLLSQIFRRSAEASVGILNRYRMAETQGVAAIMEPAIARWFSDEFRAASPEAVQQIRDMVSRTRPRAFLDTYHAFATTDAELADEAGAIACPVLLASGEHDGNSTPSEAQALAAAMRDARTAVIPGARHLISVEAPACLNAELLRFLSQRGRAAA